MLGQGVAFHCCFARAKVLSSAIATEPFSVSRLALLRAITTRSTFPGSDSRSRRNQSRTRLLMRLRTTAFPTRRLALIPTRLRSPQAFGVMIMTLGGRRLTPRPSTPPLSRDTLKIPRIKQAIGPLKAAGPPNHGYLEATLVAKRLRPFARRRFKMARPERVFMRSRNPCFRSRLIRLG